jgi:Domain of unknown function (DUF222)
MGLTRSPNGWRLALRLCAHQGRELDRPNGASPNGASPNGASPNGVGPNGADPNDELDRLGDRIAELAVHLDVATARLLDLIREFDARGGWNTGFRNCTAWLSWRVGLSPGAAREHVRVARALGALPRLAQAFARGELSYAKVRAFTRVATPETSTGRAPPSTSNAWCAAGAGSIRRPRPGKPLSSTRLVSSICIPIGTARWWFAGG